MTTLIVNADDFGLTIGVNRSVVELHAAGALTSATLMANGSCFVDAVERSQHGTAPATGCHVVLVDGTPMASAGEVQSLVQQDGRLRDSLPHFLFDLQRGRVREDEIAHEAAAQIRHLQNAGVTVTHVDTHKHTHLFPRVARPVMRAAAACGVRAIRNPFEPAWSAQFTRGAFVRKLEVTLLRNFEAEFLRLCHEHGMKTTDGCIGVSATGQLDAATLQTLLRQAPDGCFELVCHPGYHDQALDHVRTRLKASREIERQALLQQIPEAHRSGRIRLASFADLS